MTLEIIGTRWPSVDAREPGTPLTGSWLGFFAELAERASRDPFLGEHHHPGWSPASFSEGRRALERVERGSALCLDYEGGGTTPEQAIALWAGRFGFVHSTRKHAERAPRFRVVLPFARAISGAEYRAIWSVAAAKMMKAGHGFDRGARDASRFWFLPGRYNLGAPVVARVLEGEPIDVDRALAAIASRRSAAPPRRPVYSSPGQGSRYARAALDRAVEAVRSAPVGSRNQTLCREAFCVAGFIGAGELGARDVVNGLLGAAIAAGLSEDEALGVIDRGVRAGAAKPRRGAA